MLVGDIVFKVADYDVVVVGAGHAGCEAGLATARMGFKTAIFAINLDSIAMMPCNPAMGGPAKGHLIREVDALGGEIGVNTDKTMIQVRTLNTGKGPAVQALRAQCDKKAYQFSMKYTLEKTPNLDVIQGEVVEIKVDGRRVSGVLTMTGAFYGARIVIVTTGTYLNGKIIIGDVRYSGGPNGLYPATELSSCLKRLGVKLMRFKTGTPPRVDRRTIDFDKMVIQPGDETPQPFSYINDRVDVLQIPCYLTYTNEKTHEVIRLNLSRSPLYSGKIEGIGPRYCPSIEDKVVKFPHKERHQIFIEPEGINTYEMYVQGMSTSMPEDVQHAFLRTIAGLENVRIMRDAYAIEYDCIDPTQLTPWLELKDIHGLFFAGQVNGTSGYEEAAAQGIMAGVNAALQLRGEPPFILDRSESYIGVLIDDLVTKGTNEPYRMMTSRAEYRLFLRHDNADLRLTEKGYRIGLVSQERYQRYLRRKSQIYDEIERLKRTRVSPTSDVINFLQRVGSSEIRSGISLYELLKRPEITYENLKVIDYGRPDDILQSVIPSIEIEIKYEGYIKKEAEQIESFKRLEDKQIPPDIDYNGIAGLSLEARQKLSKIRPVNVGQASRISGVSPSDISVLLMYLRFKG
ncbi:tRNA uridine-5-carboxymethylaminomethyl(34) synthesis enzyme MnmG [Calorimonas adulescens]|uniref:tRNA uridine 5-carboxymethylaminomethyl modification enzyme MnmG n=1 Tax=Calorimonas adulescens TaxID=2606906 RepID=A0A5D8QBR3_9THEO|nr:tRNA uridine-5-carboxymethylaminomethyl(34) synthesis enzyme MnmG [Calorimonas adulescens]TZE80758.1 tRNA uridine-5-carboxymethylaminomethyl(34) synthesis enzyme MnmG [Calorimonas adulescens]